MKKAILAATIIALAVLPAHAEFLGFGKKEPIDMNDARAVLEMLRPSSAGGSFDVYLAIRANGEMYLTMKMKGGAEVMATGATLKDVVDDLAYKLRKTESEAASAAEAARAILNTGKPSQ